VEIHDTVLRLGLTDQNQQLTDAYTYSPYGKIIDHNGTSENSFLFTGEQLDSETDDYYLRARYYSPSSSRFLSRDSYDGTLGDPITQNHYAYGNSNPSMFVDPSGNVGIIEIQFNLSARVKMDSQNRIMVQKAMINISKQLGCNLVINYVEDMLTEGIGLYFFETKNNKFYVGRTNNFLTRLRVHLRKKISALKDVLGRIKFHNMPDLLSTELHAVEELLIRAIDDATGGNLSGMDNETYNYGGGNKKNGKGQLPSKALDKLIGDVQNKCK